MPPKPPLPRADEAHPAEHLLTGQVSLLHGHLDGPSLSSLRVLGVPGHLPSLRDADLGNSWAEFPPGTLPEGWVSIITHTISLFAFAAVMLQLALRYSINGNTIEFKSSRFSFFKEGPKNNN